MTHKSAVSPGDRKALAVANFFVADVQAGVGPFLGVLLASRGWGTAAIGAVTALGNAVGLASTTPAGALIDATRRKRFWVAAAAICTVAASALVLVSRDFWVVAAAQAAAAVAAAVLGPAIIGITLGVVRQSGFVAQNGRNQAYNHAGNMVGAALSGCLGWYFGFAAVFVLAAAFAIVAVVATLSIPARHIDDQAARGAADVHDCVAASGLQILARSPALRALAAAVLLFHLGNAAMLPLYGLAVVAHTADPFITVAATVVVAQAVMVIASLAATRIARRRGYWTVFTIAFIALPVRGLVAASIITTWGIVPVQILDGIGAGMLSVAVPGLVAQLLEGTGHINIGQGALMTAQSLGACLSPLLGGYIAQEFGFRVAFACLGALSVGSLLIWHKCASAIRAAEAPAAQEH
ncbi:MFS transporter [Mycobacteroides chelonae]|uniref:MFS transporter n=1 Tax=Mycobacteroides chelonae TaxID=1774 RepID=UPI0008A9E6F4|nr:MFS transporter [Mycobacteroides chelonae]MBF9352451.1 MFS transporter [Mycobacteroides chelonae]OHU36665.1 MFS transporter [Mycobacteroides chelonae]